MKPYFETELGKLYNGDCLEVMDELIKQGIKVDAIITDPPYAILNGLKLPGFKEVVKWDNKLNWGKTWEKLNSLIKLKGNIILFNQMPYSMEMINSNLENFHHEVIWYKNNCAQGMMAKIMPLRYHESIYVFRKNIDRTLQKWFHNQFNKGNLTRKSFNEKMGFATTGGGVSSSWFSDIKIDWQLPSYEQYRKIQEIFPCLFKKEYEEFAVVSSYYPKGTEKSILEFGKDMEGLHPTQKPLELIKYLIETYTKENDLILDFTSGSGTLAEAAEQLKRRWICIELEKKYCKVTKQRFQLGIQQTLL